MLSRADLVKRVNWLELEMCYEWCPALNAFVNLDLELEARAIEFKATGRDIGELARAWIPARTVRTTLSYRTFQRAVRIIVERARGLRPSRRGAKTNSA